ncbi:MAG: extracellular solute-binding protein, partial [Ardenticatenaceae bacterium]
MSRNFARFLRVLGAALLLAMVMLPSSTHASRVGLDPAAAASPALQRPPGENQANAIEIQADAFGVPLTDHESAREYEKPAVYLQQGDTIVFTVSIEEESPYTVSFDVAAPDSFLIPPEGELRVEGAFPSEESPRIIFPVFYQNSEDEFPLDRYGNEALIRQAPLVRWTNVAMRDANFSQRYPLQVQLSAGEHRFEFEVTAESLLLGSIYLEPFAPYPSYADYLEANPAPDATEVLVEIEAEHPSFKNDTAIRPTNSRSLAVTPYHTSRLLLNTLGGENWDRSGSTVYYEFTVPRAGMYVISLRAL